MPSRLFLICMTLLAGVACRGRDDLDGSRRPIPGLGETAREYHLDRHGLRLAYDFYDNRAAAGIHVGGRLRIDAGSVEFVKYIDGGYRTRWHLGVEVDGRRAALIDGLGGELAFPLDHDPDGIARARDGSLPIEIEARAAKPHQLVSVFLNEVRLGDIAMPTTEWKRYSIPAPAETIREGENRLRFYFRYAGDLAGQRSAAAIATLSIGSGTGQAGMTAEAAIHGDQRMAALHVPGASRLSYYLPVPARGAQLLLATAGVGPLSIQVAGQGSGGATRVWEGAGSEKWKPARVDLGDFAGEVVRIDLVSGGVADWGRPQLGAAPAEPPAGASAGVRPADHVIVWVVAALRYDRFAAEKPPAGFSQLVERGIRFTHASSAAPMPGPAHVALMTGRYPRGGHIPPTARTLAERFRDAGYSTALISGNGFVNDEAGFARGFDTYINPMRLRNPFGAHILWQKARRVLQNHRDGHAFVYVATVEPHLPYTPSHDSVAREWRDRPMRFSPAETAQLSEAVRSGKERLTQEERDYITALYDAEVRDSAAAFAEMLDDLDQMGLRDRTAIILVGDHGEELFERGNFGHGDSLYQEVLHVPLVVAPPGMAGPQVVDRAVELVDVYPTALALAGIPVNPSCQGRSLLGGDGDDEGPLPEPVQSHLPGWGRSLRLGRYQLIVPLRGGYQLYDLVADPAERNNLAGKSPLVERYLRDVFGIAVAFQSPWSRQRWGTALDTKAAFAADHGL